MTGRETEALSDEVIWPKHSGNLGPSAEGSATGLRRPAALLD